MRSLKANYIVKRNKKSAKKKEFDFLDLFSKNVYRNKWFDKNTLKSLLMNEDSCDPRKAYYNLITYLTVTSWDIDQK